MTSFCKKGRNLNIIFFRYILSNINIHKFIYNLALLLGNAMAVVWTIYRLGILEKNINLYTKCKVYRSKIVETGAATPTNLPADTLKIATLSYIHQLQFLQLPRYCLETQRTNATYIIWRVYRVLNWYIEICWNWSWCMNNRHRGYCSCFPFLQRVLSLYLKYCFLNKVGYFVHFSTTASAYRLSVLLLW